MSGIGIGPQTGRAFSAHLLPVEARTAAMVLTMLTIGAYLPTPLYPRYQEAFGFSDATLVVVYAVFALVSAPALLLFGPASDALGRRIVLRAGVVLAALGSLAFLFAHSAEWLIAGRALQGLALGAATGPATAVIVERAHGASRKWASMAATIAFAGGTALGPLFGGVLAEYAPEPTALPFIIHILLLVPGWHRISRMSAPAPGSTPPLRRWRPTRPRVPRTIARRFAFSAGTGFLAWSAAGLFLAAMPALAARHTGMTNPALTGGILAAMLLCSMAVQPLGARIDPVHLQIHGLVILLVSMLLLTAIGTVTRAPMLAAAILTGIGHGLGFAGAANAVDAHTPPGQRGGVNAALYLAFYLGSGAPAVVIALLTFRMPLDDAVSGIAASGVLLTATGIITAMVHLGRHRHSPRRPGTAHGGRAQNRTSATVRAAAAAPESDETMATIGR